MTNQTETFTIDARYNVPFEIAKAISVKSELNQRAAFEADGSAPMGAPAFILDEDYGLIGVVAIEDEARFMDASDNALAWLDSELNVIFDELYGEESDDFWEAFFPELYQFTAGKNSGLVKNMMRGAGTTEEGGLDDDGRDFAKVGE